MFHTIVLASKSPRRQALIQGLEYHFRVETYETDESFPPELRGSEIATYLAKKKADHYPGKLNSGEVLLTADTIVWINDHVLNKPQDEVESMKMLKEICGATHEVFTGVCLTSNEKQHVFFERSEVTCKPVSDADLRHYIEHYQPFDKAGSYGIQDWFGYTAVEGIHGCFYNVMGLPVSRVHEKLRQF